MKAMLIFPGQGSQYVGMGKDFYEKYEVAKKIFNDADNILNYKISDIIFNGTEEDLKNTKISQPAIMIVSIAILEVIRYELEQSKINFQPIQVAGHSLGEYTALYSTNSVSFEDILLIIQKRGKYMSESCPVGGGMLAVLGSDKIIIENTIEKLNLDNNEILSIANDNCNGQIIISGHLSAIDKFLLIANENNIKKCIKLPVSGPFHSKLMQSAQDKITNDINNLEIKALKFPLMQNFSTKCEINIDNIKNNLTQQITGQVRWREIIENAINNDNIDTFIEIGPKNVLSGMIKKISDKVDIYNIGTVDELNKIKTMLNILKYF